MPLFISLIVITLLMIIVSVTLFYKSNYKEKTGKSYLKTILNKGNRGEYLLFRKLTPMFGVENVFVNIYLKTSNNRYTEIDVVAIGRSTIFVFEMKNYSGRIYGSKNGSNWTQTFNKNSKYPFYNPLKQNRTHLNAVKRELDIDEGLLKGYVVFGNGADLDYLKMGKRDGVIKLSGVRKAIRREDELGGLSFSNEIKILFQDKFRQYENASYEIKKSHREYVEERKKY